MPDALRLSRLSCTRPCSIRREACQLYGDGLEGLVAHCVVAAPGAEREPAAFAVGAALHQTGIRFGEPAVMDACGGVARELEHPVSTGCGGREDLADPSRGLRLLSG
jgi:hypothetical protein